MQYKFRRHISVSSGVYSNEALVVTIQSGDAGAGFACVLYIPQDTRAIRTTETVTTGLHLNVFNN